jgi:hypothetical protein
MYNFYRIDNAMLFFLFFGSNRWNFFTPVMIWEQTMAEKTHSIKNEPELLQDLNQLLLKRGLSEFGPGI